MVEGCIQGNNLFKSIIFQLIGEAKIFEKISSFCTREQREAGSGFLDGGSLDFTMVGNVT